MKNDIQRHYGKLTDQDLVELLPAIIKAIEQLAPSNEMFGDGIRLVGLNLVSRLHIRAGLPLRISVIELDRWGSGKRLPRCLEYLGRYGSGAGEVLPQLQEMRLHFTKNQRGGKPNPHVVVIDRSTAGIEADTPSPMILDLNDFKSRPAPGRKNPPR
jgi:hypothetical protein